VAPGGYLWWYVDALSDDGRFGLTLIAFVGSVFSPYYAWAQRRGPAPADNYCCLNVALYGPQRRWTMTERGARWCERDAHHFRIGPSALHWDGSSLTIDIDEVGVPIPQRVRGRVVLHPGRLFPFTTRIDPVGRHRWGPIAPSARVEVDLDAPRQRWQGQAYLDSNEGEEPIAKACREWDWSRSTLRDGSTAVLYDVQNHDGSDHLLALRFGRDGSVTPFEAPPRQPMGPTGWRVARRMRAPAPVQVLHQLEDTPFYQRSVLRSELLGETVTSFHETLNVPRLVSPVVQGMLPFRMPRRG
jgi:carotenoid 1,2-hydratase